METKSFPIKDWTIDVCLLAENEAKQSYFIVATSRDRQVGYCSFYFNASEATLNRIVVTDSQFLNKGVGQVMLRVMEQFCHEKGIRTIGGYFLPRVYPDAWDKTSNFYARNGFKGPDGGVDFYDRDEIWKYVNYQGKEFSLQVVFDEELYNKIYEYNYNINDLFSSNRKDESLTL